MTTWWREYRQFPFSTRLLLINQFGINLGFFMLMPYLADYLANDLALAGWTVGLVLGVRNLSQQGMFFLGGALADRVGYRPVIIAGCALRVVAFVAIGLATSFVVLLVASILIGIAGALFNPAVRAYVATDAGEQRVSAFAAFNVCYQAGALLGPVVGVALLATDFRMVCLTAAAIFGVLSLAQWRWLPPRHCAGDTPSAASASVDTADPAVNTTKSVWRIVLGNRRFLLFATAMSASAFLTYQTYLLLPLAIEKHAADGQAAWWVAAVFGASGVTAIVAQQRLTRRLRNRYQARLVLATGVLLAGLAFAPPAVGLLLGGTGLAVLAGVVGTGVLLGLANALTFPFEMDAITTFARRRWVATHYGVAASIGGVCIVAGNLATGALIDVSQRSWDWLPWFALVLVGVGGAVLLTRLPTVDQQPPAPARAPGKQPALTTNSTG